VIVGAARRRSQLHKREFDEKWILLVNGKRVTEIIRFKKVQFWTIDSKIGDKKVQLWTMKWGSGKPAYVYNCERVITGVLVHACVSVCVCVRARAPFAC
jgi:hypothetical protein